MPRGGIREGQGRKAQDGVVDTVRVNVSLDLPTITKAREIGQGNLSAGIRAAVAQAKTPKKNRAGRSR